jgi:hypothetical protein
MEKYEWFNKEKTKLRMNISENPPLWREVSSDDQEYLSWASQEGNVAFTPEWITTILALEAANPEE